MGGGIMRAAFLILLCSLTLLFAQQNEVNGVVSPEIEERIIKEEIAAGRMKVIVPGQQTSQIKLPSGFYRSSDKAFPPIGSQKGGSCTGWATTYYAATYQVAKREGWDAQNGGRAYNCSPHWTYNFINGGADNGGSMTNNNEVMIQHGVATWEDFPEGDPNRATSWSTDPAVWRSAIDYRMKSKLTISNVNTAEGLEILKEHIYNEIYGITFSTNSPSSGSHWIWTDILDDPSTNEDDPFVGQEACYYVLSNQGGRHALAVMGWNDDIWVDVNQNGSIDAGEKGALLISESHGTYAGNDGFYWLAYDALNPESQVTNGPNSNRSAAFSSQRAYVCELREPYTPGMFAEFTLQTAARIDVVIEFLRVEVTASPPFSNPEDSWKGYVFGTMNNSSGNRLGFDGNDYSSDPSSAPEGTFVFDLTDIYPADVQPDDVWRYVMEVTDRTAGMPVTVKSFKVIVPDRRDSVFVSQNTPIEVDDDVDYVWVDVPYHPTSIIGGKDAFTKNNLVVTKTSGNRITFTINCVKQGSFALKVYNIAGKRVWEYKAGSIEPGVKTIDWNLKSNNTYPVGSGIYVVSYIQDGKIFTKKFSIIPPIY